MPNPSSQTFVKELDRKLRSAADKLRANLDVTVYSRAEQTGASAEMATDQHPNLRGDLVMASDWWDEKLGGDLRWTYGTPPRESANFAWITGQHGAQEQRNASF